MAKHRSGVNRDIARHLKSLATIAEVGWHEQKTTEYIEKALGEPLRKKNVGKSKVGIVCKIGNGTQGIFLRADIDGLPRSDGKILHLCGHNAHTASLICAYRTILRYENVLSNQNKCIYFIFQPAEETFPSGARTVLKENSDLINQCLYGFGSHVAPFLPAGSILIKSGPVFAAGDYFRIVITGKSAHIKDALKGMDAIWGAAQVVDMVYRFQKTFKGYGSDMVFNVNTINGGTVANRIADTVTVTGDIRWLKKEHGKKIKSFFTTLPRTLKEKYPGTITVSYYDGYPALHNDEALEKSFSDFYRKNATMKILHNAPISLGTEDFSFYTKTTPCLYTHIGMGGKYDLHHDHFTATEQVAHDMYQYFIAVAKWFKKF